MHRKLLCIHDSSDRLKLGIANLLLRANRRTPTRLGLHRYPVSTLIPSHEVRDENVAVAI